PLRIIELGVGDGQKTEILVRQLCDAGLEFEYVPVDICGEAVQATSESLRRRLPSLSSRIHGIQAEYFDALSLLGEEPGWRNLVLFLGSNIGNFDPAGTRRFLGKLRRSLEQGDFALIG